MKLNTIKKIGRSDFVNMGPIRLRQPIPTNNIENIDPFILLHHYGPYHVSEKRNPFDLGPHPHRGFEPITFLLQGQQLHRDSLGNESVVRAGDVQWTTAGRGVIHSEGPTKEFLKEGGLLEGIQLWLNLPSEKKMIPANYQHVLNDDFRVINSEDNKTRIQVIAGVFNETYGRIKTQTPVNVYMISMEKDSKCLIPINKAQNALLYLIDGNVTVNNETVLEKNENQLIEFNQDGTHLSIESNSEAKLLFLSGEPFNEKIVTWGPYVMNNQTEIMEALRDYKQGKMGFLPVN